MDKLQVKHFPSLQTGWFSEWALNYRSLQFNFDETEIFSGVISTEQVLKISTNVLLTTLRFLRASREINPNWTGLNKSLNLKWVTEWKSSTSWSFTNL